MFDKNDSKALNDVQKILIYNLQQKHSYNPYLYTFPDTYYMDVDMDVDTDVNTDVYMDIDVDCKDINIKSDMKSNYKNLKITNLFKK
jgi:hypothetical protein